MRSSKTVVVGIALALMGAGSLALAEPPHGEHGAPEHGGQEHGGPAHGAPEHGGPSPAHGGPAHEAPGRGEPHAGPKGYSRGQPPHVARPAANFDRHGYQHNFQAARSFRIGPYHRPAGWAVHHWGYGQMLPRAYFAPEYLISDYWLFSLEVPPVGFEWVRDDSDALLIDINTGEILQVEYGVFG